MPRGNDWTIDGMIPMPDQEQRETGEGVKGYSVLHQP